ncbi:DUF2550 family protein, partial [Actinomyces sp. MRS3W]|uniref:DUF2550 family protein n=1 Tax=Actinomyces sp. MRS3W TaxID=2800796 RepID=UPI0028FDA87E
MPVWEIVSAVALVALALVAVFLLRLRSLAGRIGAFECALRRRGRPRWRSGIAVFRDDDVEWYRLVSFSLRPRYRFVRDGLELGQARHRGRGGRIVDVPCRYGDMNFKLAMMEDSHSALVAWIESAAPTQP